MEIDGSIVRVNDSRGRSFIEAITEPARKKVSENGEPEFNEDFDCQATFLDPYQEHYTSGRLDVLLVVLENAPLFEVLANGSDADNQRAKVTVLCVVKAIYSRLLAGSAQELEDPAESLALAWELLRVLDRRLQFCDREAWLNVALGTFEESLTLEESEHTCFVPSALVLLPFIATHIHPTLLPSPTQLRSLVERCGRHFCTTIQDMGAVRGYVEWLLDSKRLSEQDSDLVKDFIVEQSRRVCADFVQQHGEMIASIKKFDL